MSPISFPRKVYRKQEAEIKALKDQRDKEYAEAHRKSRQRAAEAAEAKRRADANERKRKKQKKEDERIKKLIKKARSADAGEDALKDLVKGRFQVVHSSRLQAHINGKLVERLSINDIYFGQKISYRTCDLIITQAGQSQAGMPQ